MMTMLPSRALEPVEDPLLYRFPLELREVLYPMGYPVEIATNSSSVIQAAREAWPGAAQPAAASGIAARFAVTPGAGVRGDAPVLRGQEHLVSWVLDHENFAFADLNRGFLFGWLTEDVVRDRGWLRYHVLEAIIYTMLGALYCTPVHAACIARKGRALLLCGDSGAGKTSLAYACAKRGWTYVADDATYIPRNRRRPVALGRPDQIRFRASAAELFSELRGFKPVVRPNGKPDLELSTPGLGLRTAPEADIAALVFLRRSVNGTARAVLFPQPDALRHLSKVLCVGDDRVRAEQREHIESLTRLPTWRLDYSSFDGAEAQLRELLDEGV